MENVKESALKWIVQPEFHSLFHIAVSEISARKESVLSPINIIARYQNFSEASNRFNLTQIMFNFIRPQIPANAIVCFETSDLSQGAASKPVNHALILLHLTPSTIPEGK
jgi:hypothetical protein